MQKGLFFIDFYDNLRYNWIRLNLHNFIIFNNFLQKKERYFKSDFWGLKHYYISIFGRKRSAQLAFLSELLPSVDQTLIKHKLNKRTLYNVKYF